MMIKIDGRWLNPELVELLEEDGIANTLVTFTSGANVILQAIEPDRVAELLDRPERTEVEDALDVRHYHELGNSYPVCWEGADRDVPFKWDDNLVKVDCDECRGIVLARRPSGRIR